MTRYWKGETERGSLGVFVAIEEADKPLIAAAAKRAEMTVRAWMRRVIVAAAVSGEPVPEVSAQMLRLRAAQQQAKARWRAANPLMQKLSQGTRRWPRCAQHRVTKRHPSPGCDAQCAMDWERR